MGMRANGNTYLWAKSPGSIKNNISPETVFSVSKDGYLFSKSGNIAGWEIAENELSKKLNGRYVGISTGINIPAIVNNKNEEITNTCFWAGNYDSNESRLLPNFYVKQNGYLYSKLGKIGNWNIGDGGLYQNKSDYNEPIEKFTTGGSGFGVYVGSDGIRLGDTFYVTDTGKIYALSGNIGGCTVNSGGISGGSGWKIEPGGHA